MNTKMPVDTCTQCTFGKSVHCTIATGMYTYMYLYMYTQYVYSVLIGLCRRFFFFFDNIHCKCNCMYMCMYECML